MNDSSISIKSVSDLLTDSEGKPAHFWIPDYQRGYRWKPLQVTQLLDDVWEFRQDAEENGKKESFYCLQPLVIKARKDGSYEVVDGQQRITTIYILFTYLKDLMSALKKDRFKLTFQTRGINDKFLDDIDCKRAKENIDFFHICKAYCAIKEWFSNRDGSHQLALLQTFLSDDEAGKNVKVIWFQLSDQEDAVDAFTRLNVGKIQLTNDELIRALFLRREATTELGSGALQLRIALEWDQLEKSLQSDAFWYFISNESGPKHNRIGFLFDFVARDEGLPPEIEHDPYAIFLAYNSKIKADQTCLEKEWLRIKQAYMMLEEWYEDRTLYHITGFLIQQEEPIAALRKLSKDNTKSEFEKELRQKIFNKVISNKELPDMTEDKVAESVSDKLESLEYPADSKAIRSLLLLFNIATLLEKPESNIRFQFDCFKEQKWDIEHVRSVTDYNPERHKRKDWLEKVLCYLKTQNGQKELQADIDTFISSGQNNSTDGDFESLYARVLKEFKEADYKEGYDQRIANLTLLDQQTNRSYKNAVFAVKRQRLLSLDQGGVFVPLCTRNVFLKCYNTQADNLLFWTDDNSEKYQNAIEETLTRFFKNDRSQSS